MEACFDEFDITPLKCWVPESPPKDIIFVTEAEQLAKV